ncbi:MAG TPA: 2-hydroxychromene-2-carboxylate isomerase [Hyphomicrobiaceae bacterium]|nr:2-hydroxychromene-2-carboxylate isomerase [Hyphomicrobiaceae bacterium]
MTKPTIEFWFDFASTYSYLTAMRIDDMARDAGVAVSWQPFLLGPIFKAQGWTSSPFNIYPAKGRYMVRDMQRLAADRGLAFEMPEPFPQNSLSAARVSLAIENPELRAEFSRQVFRAEFQNRSNISENPVLEAALRSAATNLGSTIDTETLFAAASSDGIKQGLRRQTEIAQAAGIFGAPTFRTTDGEIFWGDDRLSNALNWSRFL